MGLLLFLPPAVIAIIAIYVVVIRMRHAAKGRSLGCQSAPMFKPWDILGIQTIIIELTGLKRHRFSETFLKRKNEMSRLLGRDCKTFRIYLPGEIWLYTFDPRNLQAVLATQFHDFQQPAARVGAFEPLLGLGIFSANGPKWEHSRALLRPQFMREQIADLDLFERHIKYLFEALPDTIGSDNWTSTFDMQPFLERFTMDTATEFLFGESVHSQKEDSTNMSALFSRREMMQFVETFFMAEKTTATSLVLGDLFWILHNREFKEQCKIVHKFVDTYVQRRFGGGPSDKKPGAAGRYVVLDALVSEVEDPQELRSQLLNILLAGSDTISGTLGFLLASLAQYPRVFEKLRNIILDEFGSSSQPEDITLSKLRNCSYLQWFLNEVLRVYPVVPINFKEAVRDTTLPVGGGPDGTSPVFIPKGYTVAWELWTMHSDPEFWGPDAETFNPERWEGRKLGFNYLPFNAGPRICIGQQFALAEIAYVTVRLLQKFDAIDGSALPKGPRLPCDWKLVDKVAGGVNVRLHLCG